MPDCPRSVMLAFFVELTILLKITVSKELLLTVHLGEQMSYKPN